MSKKTFLIKRNFMVRTLIKFIITLETVKQSEQRKLVMKDQIFLQGNSEYDKNID